MPTLKQLVDAITWVEVLDTLTMLAQQPRHRAYFENTLKQMRWLTPEPSTMRIAAMFTPHETGDYVHIYGVDGSIDPVTGEEEHWYIGFDRWEEWLGMEVEPSALTEFGTAEVVAACLYEMSWHGPSSQSGRHARRRIFEGPVIFISHASQDADSVARPLARALENLGYYVWFDEFDLAIGDSLRKEIATGLTRSSTAVVVLSKAFFKKAWTEREMAGIVSLETSKKLHVIPIWHGVSAKQVAAYDPSLADKVGISTDGHGIEAIAARVDEAISLRRRKKR